MQPGSRDFKLTTSTVSAAFPCKSRLVGTLFDVHSNSAESQEGSEPSIDTKDKAGILWSNGQTVVFTTAHINSVNTWL